MPMTRPQKRPISPSDPSQSLGTARNPGISAAPRSLDLTDLRMGCQERLREHVVEGKDPEEGDDDRLVDGPADALGAAGGVHALVTADDRDDRPEQGAFEQRAPEVGDRGVGEQGREEAAERLAVGDLGEDPARDPEKQRVDVHQAGDQHQAEESGNDEVFDRIDAEDLQRVELLADLPRAEVGGDRGAGDAGDDDRGHERRELADRGEDEKAPEAVEGAEEGEEVGRLKPWCSEAEGDRRDHHRKPAKLQREQELADELAAVGVGGLDRRDQRLAGEDDHVADLLEQTLDGQEGPVGYGSDHATGTLTRPSPATSRPARRRGRTWERPGTRRSRDRRTLPRRCARSGAARRREARPRAGAARVPRGARASPPRRERPSAAP